MLIFLYNVLLGGFALWNTPILQSLQIGKPIMQLSDAEVLKLIYSSTEPPHPPVTPQTVKHTTCVYKPRETVRKLPKLVIRNCAYL